MSESLALKRHDPYSLLTIKEAAEWMHISQSQLEKLLREGRLPVKPIVISERKRLLPLWGLLTWISTETGCVLPLPPPPRVQSPGY